MAKRVLIIFIYIIAIGCQSIFSQSDMIIRLDGTVEKGTVTLVSDAQISYKDGETEKRFNKSDIYMIKFKQRGNLFFLKNGTLSFDEENIPVPNDAVSIYMIWGQEYIAHQAEIKDDEIIYDTYDKKNRQRHVLPKKDVFMIRSSNGVNTVITPLNRVKIKRASPTKEQLLPIVLPIDIKSLKKTKPADAVILLQNGNSINATIIGGNDQIVAYYRKDAPKGPVYQLQREQIESIKYKTNKNTRIRR